MIEPGQGGRIAPPWPGLVKVKAKKTDPSDSAILRLPALAHIDPALTVGIFRQLVTGELDGRVGTARRGEHGTKTL